MAATIGKKSSVTSPKPNYVREIFHRLYQQNPQPKGELNFNNPYTLLVAVILSAQATDIGVNKATKHLFQSVQTPQQMIQLGLNGLIAHIKSIGLFNAKANHIMTMSQMLIDQFNGKVPNQREALESLPGVGRKTANVVLNIAFGLPTIAVDTHLFRLSHRLKLSSAKTPLKVENDLLKIIPDDYIQHAHHWLILHGRYICKSRNPQCQQCCLENICPSSTLHRINS